MSNLTLDGVTKVFTEDDGNEIVAVDDISIDIADGEFLVLVGPSGCGKSTTLRMIAGLETVTRGEIRLNGERINENSPAERDIAMVFQSYALYPHMTVESNMRFGLEESTDMSDDDIAETVRETAQMMDIGDLLERKPEDLSGGQQQRVALGRAIVRDPEAFLMDEPLSNLDAKLRAKMRTELQRLQEELDVTTVYVTHDQTEAMTMGDRIAILNDGLLQQVGTPLECYHTPANRFVAGFIGEPSMNLFRMDVDTLHNDRLAYPLREANSGAVGNVDGVTLGIRPEDIEVASSSRAGDDHAFECVIDVVEPMGDTKNVYLNFAGTDSANQETFIATVSGMQRTESGETVVVRIPKDAIHIFDATTGEAVKNRSLSDLDEAEVNV